MKEKISALMDGGLGRPEANEALAALRAGGEARETWRTYHLIGDAMRDTRELSQGFAARVAARLEQEPTVLAPMRRKAALATARWSALAAGVAAIAMVAWLAFAPQQGPELSAPVAAVVKGGPAPALPVKEAAQVAPPEQASEYLYAHQGSSPRNSLQGMAPYVRMVSGQAGARKP